VNDTSHTSRSEPSEGATPTASPLPQANLLRPSYDPVASLLSKFEGWLRQQPEWAIILTQPRAVRREATKALAHLLLTMPRR
jgi:hypothetical protein